MRNNNSDNNDDTTFSLAFSKASKNAPGTGNDSVVASTIGDQASFAAYGQAAVEKSPTAVSAEVGVVEEEEEDAAAAAAAAAAAPSRRRNGTLPMVSPKGIPWIA